MAHIAGSGNNNSGNQVAGAGLMPTMLVGGNSGVSSLRDVCNLLQQPVATRSLLPGSCPYDHIVDMIRGLDIQDDGITMNHKIKSIETDFCTIVRDENMLRESMEYINDKALADGETALKFGLLFASRNFDALAMNETKVRSAMLTILQKNFTNAETYRVTDKNRLYNSITLLGEYYHRVRLGNNSPIIILGESLLDLLIREVSEIDNVNDAKLAKLILSQITLNGDIMRLKHKTELTQLLYHIRRSLIEHPALTSAVKALFLMTLDLYYSNFTNLGVQLEEMYTKYLVMEDEDESNNNQDQLHQLQLQHEQQEQQQEQQIAQQPQPQPQPQPQQQQQQECIPVAEQNHICNNTAPENSFGNGEKNDIENSEPVDDDSFEGCGKRWSEQVCEDSPFENEDLNCESELNLVSGVQDPHNNSYVEHREPLHSANTRHENEGERKCPSRNSRRSYQPRQSPRPLKQAYNTDNVEEHSQKTRDIQSGGGGGGGGEERDESKPLPRWRAPRFNRDSKSGGDYQSDGRQRNAFRRFSASFDDDFQSVRSEGGSIRLYSINDRLKHSQEKIERSGNSCQYNSIANSNWDRQSQRDDRSERSYMSNYERGSHRRGGRHHGHRPTYDKPPRFQKNLQKSPARHNKSNNETWRRSNNAYQDENSSYTSNGPESHSRSSSRARTLPRPAKSSMDELNNPMMYRRSQSPANFQVGRGEQQGRMRTRNYTTHYSSQSSLASESSSTLDRRHHQRNRNFSRRSHRHDVKEQDWEETRSVHGQPREDSWESKDNSELIRNARQTTKYMNYLSSKK